MKTSSDPQSATDFTTELDVARQAAVLAAAALEPGYRNVGATRNKGVVDLVTEFDLAAEDAVVTHLREHFPNDRIVAEEKGAQGASEGERCWYVDPLDGTTNFAHGHPFFCVSIGLFVAKRGVVGVVRAPALSIEWAAANGICTRNGEPAHVSKTSELSAALCASGFPYDRWTREDNNVKRWDAVLRRAQGMRRCGSAALDLALVADGTYEGYWEAHLSPWDMAAGAVLVEQAGGRLSAFDGASADPLSGELVATNGAIHAQLLDVIQNA